jgi:hypothetical protein
MKPVLLHTYLLAVASQQDVGLPGMVHTMGRRVHGSGRCLVLLTATGFSGNIPVCDQPHPATRQYSNSRAPVRSSAPSLVWTHGL